MYTNEINWVTALVGGMLIGLSATILLAFTGRIAGISGIVNLMERLDSTYSTASPGINLLLQHLSCLQCRAVLLEWLHNI